MNQFVQERVIASQWSNRWIFPEVDRAYSDRIRIRYSGARLFIESAIYTAVALACRAVLPHIKWILPHLAYLALLQISKALVVAFAIANLLSLVALTFRFFKDRGREPSLEMISFETRRNNSRTSSFVVADSSRVRSPKAAVFLLNVLLPLHHRAEIIGDLDEAFADEIRPRYGPLAARIWYWLRSWREILFYNRPLIAVAASAIAAFAAPHISTGVWMNLLQTFLRLVKH